MFLKLLSTDVYLHSNGHGGSGGESILELDFPEVLVQVSLYLRLGHPLKITLLGDLEVTENI